MLRVLCRDISYHDGAAKSRQFFVSSSLYLYICSYFQLIFMGRGKAISSEKVAQMIVLREEGYTEAAIGQR